MSEAVDRIIQKIRGRSSYGSMDWDDDTDSDPSISLGDWKDVIRAELRTVKVELTGLAEELEYAGLYTATAKLRALAKDL